MPKYNVVEMFDSIDGEGLRTGHLTSFIRLAGCNLNCTYCDTVYAQGKDTGVGKSIDEIIDVLESYNNMRVTITGGEPLIQDDIVLLVSELVEYGYQVNIETNGSVPLDKFFIDSDDVIITMDYKLPSSGMEHKMVMENIPLLQEKDVLKFVVGTEADLQVVGNLLTTEEVHTNVYLSPIFESMEPSRLVEFSKQMRNLSDIGDIIVQVQLHKIIWPVDMRGV